MQSIEGTAAIPYLGSGISYRSELREEIRASRDRIDFIEIVADQFITNREDFRELRELGDMFTIVPHGLRLSVGSPVLDREYLAAVKRVSDACDSPYYSDHLAVTRTAGIDIGHLSPIWFTHEAFEIVARNVIEIQDTLQKPLILENISYAFEIPGATMSEADFFSLLVEETGCGLLLDATNLYTNAMNHKFDPVSHLDALPLDALVQLHIAGGYWRDGVLIDGHCEPVEQGTWDVLKALSERVQVRACILEHDDNFPDDFSTLLDQLQRARRLMLDATACSAQ